MMDYKELEVDFPDQLVLNSMLLNKNRTLLQKEDYKMKLEVVKWAAYTIFCFCKHCCFYD